jgi:hypothetical protein
MSIWDHANHGSALIAPQFDGAAFRGRDDAAAAIDARRLVRNDGHHAGEFHRWRRGACSSGTAGRLTSGYCVTARHCAAFDHRQYNEAGQPNRANVEIISLSYISATA